MESKRLSSLSQDHEYQGEKPTENVEPKQQQHKHHRIISFDPSSVSRLSTREIQDHNEIQMSLVSSLTTARTAQRRDALTNINMATPENLIESERTATAVRPHHIVKIFTGDHDVIEVTPEQVKRIKESKYRLAHTCFLSYCFVMFCNACLIPLNLCSA